MVRYFGSPAALVMLVLSATAIAQQAGFIRGMVYDKDFDAPLPGATVLIAETGEKVVGSDQGDYVFPQVPPGSYTLVFSKDGYAREVKADVPVSPGRLTEVDMFLGGDFAEMEEFVVQDIQIGLGGEIELLQIRFESPALMDSISSDIISRAGAGDASDALKLVAGATVQDGKYAVVRGLPDRYVNSQMNGVRLPTADVDKRAVQLDQFPSDVIQSIQVAKTFTPDQQGDASGGAVNVLLKGVPDGHVAKLSVGSGVNTNTTGRNGFLSYRGGGLDDKGNADDRGGIPSNGVNNTDAAGVKTGRAPYEYSWSAAVGGSHEMPGGGKLGVFGSFYYKHDASHRDGGFDDSYWLRDNETRLTPRYSQGSPQQENCRTALYDVTRSSEEVQWGGLAAAGLEFENNKLRVVYMYTRVTEDTATLAEDTRGKAYYDPDNEHEDLAPFLRTQTLEYTRRSTQTLQLSGRHTLETPNIGSKGAFEISQPELDWTAALSSSEMNQPDKRQFGSEWKPGTSFEYGGVTYTTDPLYSPFKPSANFTMGNFQRISKTIAEESRQGFFNLKLPFTQWTESEGYVKVGAFLDKVEREYDQDSYANFEDTYGSHVGSWNDRWSKYFPYQNHPMTISNVDVDYDAEQTISAFYYMADLPVTSFLNIIGGLRHEYTDLSITNYPASDQVRWYPPGADGDVVLHPGDADVEFSQRDLLPAIGLVITPVEQIKFRASYSQTVARQTFKELTPIQQQEYLGGDVFIGNPELKMSSLDNYDLRLDYMPYEGSLVSLSWFRKDISDPIEYVQRFVGYFATTPVNYPSGKMTGYEFELRQQLGNFWEPLTGLALGANATFIKSEVTLTDAEMKSYRQFNIPVSPSRDMSNAPDYLYNLNLTYDIEQFGAKVGLFYTVKGDTLISGEGQSNGNYVPNIYEAEYGTLNFSLSQKLGEHWTLKFSAKNLTDPKIERIYRSDILASDVTKSSYRKGIDFGLSLSAEF